MKALLVFLVVLGGALSLSTPVLRACGAKFLVSSRSARYQRMLPRVKPTRILIYWHQDASTKEEDRWNPDSTDLLEQAGHTVEVAFELGAFLKAAEQGSPDVMIIPLDDAKQIKAKVRSVAPGSALLPFLRFATRREFSDAKTEFGNALKFPATLNEVLRAVEKSREAGPNS